MHNRRVGLRVSPWREVKGFRCRRSGIGLAPPVAGSGPARLVPGRFRNRCLPL
jgi:hypothetical protein